MKNSAVSRGWRAALALCTLAVGALLCFRCLQLYRSGGFSRENVLGLLRGDAPWLLGFLGTAVISLLFLRAPAEKTAVDGSMEPMKPLARQRALRILLYACAILLTLAGVLNGGLRDVLIKAINICTECIGLG